MTIGPFFSWCPGWSRFYPCHSSYEGRGSYLWRETVFLKASNGLRSFHRRDNSLIPLCSLGRAQCPICNRLRIASRTHMRFCKHQQSGIIVHRCHHNHQTQPWLYVLLNLLINHSFDTWATTCLSRFTASKREESNVEQLKHPPLRNLILPATQAGIDLDLMPNILCGISNILRDIRKSPLSQAFTIP